MRPIRSLLSSAPAWSLLGIVLAWAGCSDHMGHDLGRRIELDARGVPERR